jgi:HD-like signal output (HDOD) protein
MLGLSQVREIALAHTIKDALPKPTEGLFDHEAFWTDSLTMALLAKSFTKSFLPGQEDTSFTVALLSDMALPVLLSLWEEYYVPVLEEWKSEPGRLSAIEREHFSWDHGQAGAWIAKSWNLSEEMVSYIGAHNLTYDEIKKCELEDTAALPISLASMAASVLKPDSDRANSLVHAAVGALDMTTSDFRQTIEDVRESFHEVRTLFGLPDRDADGAFGDLIRATEDAGDSC